MDLLKVVLILVGVVLLVVFVIWLGSGTRFLKRHLDENYIVFGSKGSGKTSMFSWFAMQYSERSLKNKRFTGYVSDTDFKFVNGLVRPCDVVNIAPNSWEDILQGNIKPIKKDFALEDKPILLDDSGIYLPSFADTMLKKKYPSMAPAVAVWRHLYNAPILINNQDLERTWKLIREQQTSFLWCRHCYHIFGLTIISFVYYDRIQSAQTRLLPLKGLMFNKFSKADVQQWKATNGTIKKHFVITRTRLHKFDSRYFHKVFFGIPAPKRKNLWNKIVAFFKRLFHRP